MGLERGVEESVSGVQGHELGSGLALKVSLPQSPKAAREPELSHLEPADSAQPRWREVRRC